MANKKISELNTASTLGDADEFVVVQGAETKQILAATIKAYAAAGGSAGIQAGGVRPTAPADGTIWVDTSTDPALAYYYDATSKTWLSLIEKDEISLGNY